MLDQGALHFFKTRLIACLSQQATLNLSCWVLLWLFIQILWLFRIWRESLPWKQFLCRLLVHHQAESAMKTAANSTSSSKGKGCFERNRGEVDSWILPNTNFEDKISASMLRKGKRLLWKWHDLVVSVRLHFAVLVHGLHWHAGRLEHLSG